MFVVHQKNKSLPQVVNKETQFLLFILTDFRSCFRVTVANFEQVFVCISKVFQRFEQQQLLFSTFPSKQMHAQSQQHKP